MVADFVTSALSAHNEYRAQHGVPALKHNPAISAIAQKWADHLARTEDLQHSSPEQRTHEGSPCGENIAYYFSSNALETFDGDMATKQWYDEIKDYDFKKAGFTPETGHFTQVVWKETQEIGLGRGRQKDGSWIIVANYYPSGNVMGHFEENVFPSDSKNQPEVTVSTKPLTTKVTVNEKKEDEKESEEKLPLHMDIIEKCLQLHNKYRKLHNVPEMTHNPKISQIAQRYANHLAKNDLFEHSKGDGRKLVGKSIQCGENLAFTSGDPGEDSAQMWYDEIKDYNFSKQGFSMDTGHFTQLVWKDSTELGVGAAKNSKGHWIIVANYYPPGNFKGRFEENVFKPVEGKSKIEPKTQERTQHSGEIKQPLRMCSQMTQNSREMKHQPAQNVSEVEQQPGPNASKSKQDSEQMKQQPRTNASETKQDSEDAKQQPKTNASEGKKSGTCVLF